jgi:hypothetical protein
MTTQRDGPYDGMSAAPVVMRRRWAMPSRTGSTVVCRGIRLDDPARLRGECIETSRETALTSGDEPQSEDPADEAGQSPANEPMIGAARRDDDAEVDDLVGGLFREVDNRFNTLEAQYAAARQDLTTADVEESLARTDPIAASAARYELVSEVATLRADVERQASELDERDRMLAELSNRIEGFEERLREADDIERAAGTTRQELHEERRELARVRALLDASAAEREELSDVAQRLKNEKDHVDLLLATAIERFEEVDQIRSQLGDDLERLEAARQAEAADHDNRFHDLTDAKAEARRLAELVDDLTTTRDDAVRRADKAESKNERRGNEVNYLNRRIESLTERANESDALAAESKRLSEENALLNRRIGDLERELESQTAQALASAAAVEAIADRSAQHDDLVARIAELEEAATRRETAQPVAETSTELQDLAQRARSLGSQRSSGAYEPLASNTPAPPALVPALPLVEAPVVEAPVVEAPSIPTPPPPADAPAAPAIAVPSAADAPAPPALPVVESPVVGSPADEGVELPVAGIPLPEAPVLDIADIPVVEYPTPAPDAGSYQAPSLAIPGMTPPAPPTPPTPEVAEPVWASDAPDKGIEAPTGAAPVLDVSAMTAPQEAVPVAEAPAPVVEPDVAGSGSTRSSSSLFVDAAGRSRMVLPPEMEPDTPEAVEYLLSQPSVTAIVDARSFCGRTGVRPSELFERIAALRDRFDVPVEVVVTPVSTPVGGAPNLAAIGVHRVTGADTVSDRVRALCLGFPPDQPIVVVAGDDHVRRAAIGEEANVVDPAVVIDVT